MPNYITGNKIIAVSRPDKRINKFIQGGAINSFSMPKEITSVAPHAFDNISGLTEIIFTNQDVVVDVSENAGIGANVVFVVPSQLEAGYEARYPNRTIATYESGYQYTIPYIGDSTLTASYVNQCAMSLGAQKTAVRKVVVPVDFTSYEAGALDAIFSAFTNMTSIESLWLNGNTTDGFEYMIPYAGDSTLTALYVNGLTSADATALAGVTKVIVPEVFTAIEDGAFDGIDANLPNVATLETNCPHTKAIYTNFASASGKIKKLVYKASSMPSTSLANQQFTSCLSLTSMDFSNLSGNINGEFNRCSNCVELKLKSVTSFGQYSSVAVLKGLNYNCFCYLPNVTYFSNRYQSGGVNLERLYLPKCTTFGYGYTYYDDMPRKVFIGTSNCKNQGGYLQVKGSYATKYYLKATDLVGYMTAGNWPSWASNGCVIGVLDGSLAYQNINNTDLSLNYPTLSSTLTIDSSGHLIENGTDLFTGYTATWYSDEDCATSISPSSITNGMTVYVKLTANA